MLKAVFFDFDGTLARTEEGYFENYRKLIKELGYTCKDEDLSFMAGMGTVIRSEYLNKKYGYAIDGESLRKRFRAMNEEMFYTRADSFLFDDVVETLEEMKKRGLAMYLCTNTKRDLILAALEVMGIGPYFAGLLSGQDEDVMIRKPDPEIYRVLLKRTGCSAEEAIVVEDSPGGVKAAKGAGIYTVGLTRLIPAEILQADVSIKSLRELPAVIDRMNTNDRHMNTVDSHLNL